MGNTEGMMFGPLKGKTEHSGILLACLSPHPLLSSGAGDGTQGLMHAT